MQPLQLIIDSTDVIAKQLHGISQDRKQQSFLQSFQSTFPSLWLGQQ